MIASEVEVGVEFVVPREKRRVVGPPRKVEEPKCPEDMRMLRRRPEPLLDRLEKVRDSSNLQLSKWARDTLDEAIGVLHRLGWD